MERVKLVHIDLLQVIRSAKKLLGYCGVYAIVCHDLEQVQHMYVGSSKWVYDRLREHIRVLRTNDHHNTRLQELYNKLGENRFVFYKLEETTLESLIEVENIFIESNHNILNYSLAGANVGDYARGKTYFEIYGTETPACGFKQGDANIAKRPEIRSKLSQNTQRMWDEGQLHGTPKSEQTRSRMSTARTAWWARRRVGSKDNKQPNS